MPTISYKTDGLFESSPHLFTIDASELRLPPGTWPKMIDTTMGNGQPFVRTSAKVCEDEILAVRYIQAAGCLQLVVFND